MNLGSEVLLGWLCGGGRGSGGYLGWILGVPGLGSGQVGCWGGLDWIWEV